MIRYPTLAACLMLAPAICLAGATANAQLVARHLVRGLEKSDVDTLQPLIRSALSEDAVGGIRKWESPSGKRGFIQLTEGGAAAGQTTGTIKITVVHADRTTSGMTFRYKQDAKGQWRSIG